MNCSGFFNEFFTEFIKSEPSEELEPPSVHYSEKYSKASKKSKKIEKQNLILNNLHFINCDVEKIFDIFKHRIFTKIFINFCDP